MWSGRRGSYKGTAVADCKDDNLSTLAKLITGDASNWRLLNRPERVNQGDLLGSLMLLG